MADGRNKEFLRDPLNFFKTYFLCVNDVTLRPGVLDVDFVNTPVPDRDIIIERYAKRTHGATAQPIHAYLLPAIFNDISTLVLGDETPYMFTSQLSGCMFAAYGPDSKHVTVEHVNAKYPEQATVTINERIAQILDQNYPFCKIVRCGSERSTDTQYYYPAYAAVMGILTDSGDWDFYFKQDADVQEYIKI